MNLPPHFFDHPKGGLAHRLHSHGRKCIRKHGPKQQTGKYERIVKRHVISRIIEASGVEVGSIKSQGDERGTANCKSLADGRRGITSTIESVSSISDFLSEFSHFGNATSVIADRSISIDRQAYREVAEHTDGS